MQPQMLANLGIIVFQLDPRSASGKGAQSTWTAYRQLGVQELKDIECGVDWLTKHPYVDAKRIGMQGHSYGGFMTAYAMTHSKLFAAGISGSPVTDWRNYDSIYTERYMNTPQENPDGYDEDVRRQGGRQPARPAAALARPDGRKRPSAKQHAVHAGAADGRTRILR